MLTPLTGELSTYELLGSGLIESLLDFLTRLDTSPPPQCYDKRLERVKVFANVFLDLNSTSSSSPDPPLPPIATLVRQLQEALDKEESFRVTIYDAMGSASSLKLLAQPLKFKLKREGYFEDDEEKKLYEQPDSLLIEPLASVEDIAHFIWQFLIPQKISAAASAAAASQRQMLKQQRQQQWQMRMQQKREEKKKASKDGNTEKASYKKSKKERRVESQLAQTESKEETPSIDEEKEELEQTSSEKETKTMEKSDSDVPVPPRYFCCVLLVPRSDISTSFACTVWRIRRRPRLNVRIPRTLPLYRPQRTMRRT